MYLLISLLVVAAVAVVWLVILVRPTEFPPTTVQDQWAAEAAVIGGGALFFAVVATAIATVAFINSTEKPSLRLEAAYNGRTEPLDIVWNDRPPDKSGKVISVGEYPNRAFRLHLYNIGQVAAPFVAIRVKFGNGARLDAKGDVLPLLDQWHTSTQRLQRGYPLSWDGGADAVIHPSKPDKVPQWSYEAPLIGPTYLILSARNPKRALSSP